MVGQSFPKFMDYNDRVTSDVKKSYPESNKQLLDLNKLLAVKTLRFVCTAYRKEYDTVKYSLRDGNNPQDKNE